MTNWLEHRLEEFVDRTREMTAFESLLERNCEQSIAVVWGDGGSGKSSLLMRMISETATRSIRSVQIDWKGMRSYDYLAFMRSVRDQLGDEHFYPFTDLVNYYTKPNYNLRFDVHMTGSNQLLSDATLTNVTARDIANVVIKDFELVVPRPDLAIADVDRMLKLTRAFLSDLRKLAEQEPVVFFLDTVENASANTETWLWHEVLQAIRERTLGNTVFIICGRKPPPLPGWTRDIIELELPPFRVEDISEYLERRGIDDPVERRGAAQMLFVATNGDAGMVASQTDSFLAYRASAGAAP